MRPLKPEFGAPCNGCGHCCKTNACHMARALMKTNEAPCKALEEQHGRFWCGLLRTPGHYMALPTGLAASVVSAYVTAELHIGDGCDDNSPAEVA